MPENKSIEVKKLKLDLNNFRTVAQQDEVGAINAMIALKPNKFWALMESILNDGFHLTENIIVLKSGRTSIVKEGNRRIASLKLIHGLVPDSEEILPDHILERIAGLSKKWKADNKKVPCLCYEADEEDVVDKIVTLTHGKGDGASRDFWNPVAKARHKRDKNQGSEPALDLLEKFLSEGTTVNKDQAERWGGDYPLSVLDEAMKRVASRCNAKNARELADKYPTIKYRKKLDSLMQDIGLNSIGFPDIRSKTDFAANKYGFPALGSPSSTKSGTGKSNSGKTSGQTQASSNKSSGKVIAKPINTERALKMTLKSFTPRGANRAKVATLLAEARSLKLSTQPHAFCFLLRSMFEISAKSYCDDHKSSGLSAKKSNGRDDKNLSVLLNDIYKHLTKNSQGKLDRDMAKRLHGATAELANPNGFLSVTSMNQLVHSQTFTVNESHICTVFSNIFPLLEAMNS